MPITHTYQKYTPDGVCGIVANDSVPVKYLNDAGGRNGVNCVSGCGSDIAVWNIRGSFKESLISRENGSKPVSALAVSVDPVTSEPLIAVGYIDGWVALYSLWNQKLEYTFRAGRHRVNSIDFSGCTISCAAESELHVMDVLSGAGYRLKGHRGAVTIVKILNQQQILLSGGRDSFIKFWCLRTQHCFLTLTGHPGPVWGLALSADRKTLVTGSSDHLLRLWKLNYKTERLSSAGKSESDLLNAPRPLEKQNVSEAIPLPDYDSLVQVEFRGTIQRKTMKRVFSLTFDRGGRFLACQTLDKTLEIYILLTEAEKASRLRKKQKKARQKGDAEASSVCLTAEDELRCIFRLTLSAKLSSCDLRVSRFNSRKRPHDTKTLPPFALLHILCSYRNNLVEEYSLKISDPLPSKATLLHTSKVFHTDPDVAAAPTPLRLANRISNPGHRSAPFGCQLTEDGLGIFTLARSEGKLWNRTDLACLVTLDWGAVGSLSKKSSASDEWDDARGSTRLQADKLKASAFVLAPGSRHVVVGFENGVICLFDLLSKQATQTICDSHNSALRSLILTGDRKGVLSGGSDQRVGFWNFDFALVPGGSPTLCLKPGRPVETVADQVTALAAAPDNRLIAVGMVNFHVDVFFADSFKRVHSLYGMAAPVTCMDISADSRLLITGSGDKTVRLWELQFGNCLRRFTTHSDPVTSVRFLAGSSLAFSADLGGIIKEWDVKKLLEVCTITGHEGAVSCLSALATKPGLGKLTRQQQQKTNKRGALSQKRRKQMEEGADEEDVDVDEDICGGLLVSVGRDFSCRVWRESEELLVMEEEALMAREAAEEEAELLRAEAVIPGAVAPEAAETGPLGRPTVTTRNAADTLMEAVDIYTKQISDPAAPPDPLMAAYQTSDPDRFLFTVFSSLRLPAMGGGLAGLEHSLGMLHSDHVVRLLPCLAEWFKRGWDLELVGRAIRYLCSLHAGLVTTSTELCDALSAIQTARRSHLSETRKLIGVNLAALDFLRQKIEEEQPVTLFQDAASRRSTRVQKFKARMAKQAAVLTK
uniref:Small-subunit processome Utp12 domain-containing protein n=2 Tax=Schistocephalus solidus TaxID=70667 RepID=A0A0X3P1S5_SCHSO